MNDWIKHDGGPQPVADDVWVDVELRNGRCVNGVRAGMLRPVNRAWPVDIVRYRILNQHLIDAARLEGIRLGLEAAAKAADAYDDLAAMSVKRLDPETIAREAADKETAR
jgi:hypothetical protein